MPTMKKKALKNDCTYDATSMAEFQGLLRQRLKDIQSKKEPGSLRAIGNDIGVSHVHLLKFRDGGYMCMDIMNRLANHFGFRYYLENYEE